MEKVSEYIYYTPYSIVDPHWEYKAGYYFIDETQDYMGPYKTEEEALKQSKLYYDWLDSDDTHP